MQNPNTAAATLRSRGFTQSQIDKVLNHTHCTPPEDYFITSEDMVGKAGVWGHFGSWDFTKADAYQRFRSKPMDEAIVSMATRYNISDQSAEDIYVAMQSLRSENDANNWMAPWPGYPHSWQSCSSQDNVTYKCNLNIQLSQQQNGAIGIMRSINFNSANYSKTTLDLVFADSQGRQVGQNTDIHPSGIIFARDDSFSGLAFNGSSSGQTFLVDIVDGVPTRTMIVDPANGASMFTRLFFMDGKGTTAFMKFSDKTTFAGQRIIVWKIDWSKLEDYDLA